MAEHTFGGDWTESKLACLAKYLTAYRAIFTNNEKAKHFSTWYVDAFAGSGSRVDTAEPSDTQLFADAYDETTGYREGSARKALGLAAPFDHYLFIDKSKTHLAALKAAIETDFPALLPRCVFEVGDSNEVLSRWCAQRDWKKDRAVVFLDPYGMQVEWKTVETLGATRGVDLWYLFPLGVGVTRLLKRDGAISEGWQRRLELLFGTKDWRDQFYQPSRTTDLFGDVEQLERDASVETISAFLKKRLETCYIGVADGKVNRPGFRGGRLV